MKKILLSMMVLLMSMTAMAEVKFGYDAGFDLVSTTARSVCNRPWL